MIRLLLPLSLPLSLLLAACPGEAPMPRADSAADHSVTLFDGPGPGHEAHPVVDTGSPLVDKGVSAVDSKPKPDLPQTGVVPPLSGSSGGSGGSVAPSGIKTTLGGVTFNLVVPSTYQASKKSAALIIYSGTEGADVMTQNMLSVAPYVGLGDLIIAVLDGTTYFGNGQAGATVLDQVRARYNIDNDRTYLLSESAGTSAGLQLGLQLRQSYFAAYWANDVNASATPSATAAQLGFAPWGNAGPGGQLATATAIVAGMKSAGYRLPADAPYSGAGSTQHGSPQQFMAAVSFFKGKSRQ